MCVCVNESGRGRCCAVLREEKTLNHTYHMYIYIDLYLLVRSTDSALLQSKWRSTSCHTIISQLHKSIPSNHIDRNIICGSAFKEKFAPSTGNNKPSVISLEEKDPSNE